MTTAQLVLDNKAGKWNLVHNNIILMSSTAKYYLRQQVKQGRWTSLGITAVEETDTAGLRLPTLGITAVEDDKFDINERFQFVHQFAKATGEKKMPSFILTGPGGIGKTDTIMQGLAAAKLVNYRSFFDDVIEEGDEMILTPEMHNTCYAEVSGCTTARGLYNTLYEHRNHVIVFDDCDDVWGDSRARDILKAALDSYEERWVSWGAQASFGDTVPRAFRFYGSIIFVSNLKLQELDKPIRTRSVCVDLTMTADEMVERITMIANSDRFMPHIDLKTKLDCLSLIDVVKYDVRELSIRTLITAINIKLSCDNWERVAEYAICR